MVLVCVVCLSTLCLLSSLDSNTFFTRLSSAKHNTFAQTCWPARGVVHWSTDQQTSAEVTYGGGPYQGREGLMNLIKPQWLCSPRVAVCQNRAGGAVTAVAGALSHCTVCVTCCPAAASAPPPVGGTCSSVQDSICALRKAHNHVVHHASQMFPQCCNACNYHMFELKPATDRMLATIISHILAQTSHWSYACHNYITTSSSNSHCSTWPSHWSYLLLLLLS